MTLARVGLLLCVCGLPACAQEYFASSGTDGETGTATGSASTLGTDAGGEGAGTSGGSGEEGADTQWQSGGSGTLGPSSTSGGTTAPVCGEGIDIYEDDSMAVCQPAETTTERIVQCLCAYDPPLLEAAARPLDATDLLYYANRWYSIDPCFPFTPPSALLANVRETYINAVDDLEPEMLQQCGDYEIEMIQIPPAFTNDSDQLLSYAWSSPVPEDYPETLDGDPVGLVGQVGFAPMFAAAAEDGIGLFVQSGFRSTCSSTTPASKATRPWPRCTRPGRRTLSISSERPPTWGTSKTGRWSARSIPWSPSCTPPRRSCGFVPTPTALES